MIDFERKYKSNTYHIQVYSQQVLSIAAIVTYCCHRPRRYHQKALCNYWNKKTALRQRDQCHPRINESIGYFEDCKIS